MGILDIQPVKYENFSTDIKQHDGRWAIHLIGDLDMADPGAILTPYLNELHQMICSEKIKEIDLDIQSLSFINSSSIKILLNWLLKIKLLEKETRYIVCLVFNTNITWQSSAFKPLSIFAAECFTM